MPKNASKMPKTRLKCLKLRLKCLKTTNTYHFMVHFKGSIQTLSWLVLSHKNYLSFNYKQV